MTRWRFCRKSVGPLTDASNQINASAGIDASAVQRRWLAGKNESEILSLELVVDGRVTTLGELFDVAIESADHDQLVFEGDLQSCHGLGTNHDRGEIHIHGVTGHYVGAGMTGGKILVHGSCGDFAGAPGGARKTGMAGGSIIVAGDTGDYTGYRMRRGTITVGGSAGNFVAASMVAGTVCIGKEVGGHLAVGMKRGTVVLAGAKDGWDEFGSAGNAIASRFSSPVEFTPGFLNLYREETIHEMVGAMAERAVLRTRADRTVGGLGEILFAGPS